MVTSFIFDIDGTLLDSNDFHARAWVEAFGLFGKKISFSKIRPCMGKGADQLLPEFLSKREIKSIGEGLDTLSGAIFKCKYLSQVRPFPKVRPLFERIRAKGARIALASSSGEDEVAQYRKIARIEDLVEHSASGDDARKSKPAPDIFKAALKLLGNPKRDSVLVIGDSPYDGLAATKAKLPVLGVLCGGFPKSTLRESGCQLIYEDPADILKNLETIYSYSKTTR